MIEVSGINKFYGPRQILHDVSFTVPNGSVTGFVGPNGAGKSTTLRVISGLEDATAGTALVDGLPMAQQTRPLSALGCLLNTDWFMHGRSARDHLRILAAPQSIPLSRIDYLLEMVELHTVAKLPVKTFSLGMRQRLGIAAAFLGDAHNYILDEPVNGLDPQAISWLRQLLQAEAERGKSILLSSHLMSEMSQVADRVVMIDQGKIIADAALTDFVRSSTKMVLVAADDPRLVGMIEDIAGAKICRTTQSKLLVSGTTTSAISHRAVSAGIILTHLSEQSATLEEAYLAHATKKPQAQNPPPVFSATAVNDSQRFAPPTSAPQASSPNSSETTPTPRRYPSRKDRR